MIPAGVIEFFSFNASDQPLITLLKLAFWIVVVGLLAIKSTDHVDQGQLALRKRGGRVVRYRYGPHKGRAKVYGPGLKSMIPFLDSYWKMVVQRRQIELRPQTRQENGRYYMLVANIAFRIIDIEKALIDNENIDAIVIAICEMRILKMMRKNVASDLIGKKLMKDRKVQETLTGLGAELISVGLVYNAETDNSQLAWALHAAGVAPYTGVSLVKASDIGHLDIAPHPES